MAQRRAGKCKRHGMVYTVALEMYKKTLPDRDSILLLIEPTLLYLVNPVAHHFA